MSIDYLKDIKHKGLSLEEKIELRKQQQADLEKKGIANNPQVEIKSKGKQKEKEKEGIISNIDTNKYEDYFVPKNIEEKRLCKNISFEKNVFEALEFTKKTLRAKKMKCSGSALINQLLREFFIENNIHIK